MNRQYFHSRCDATKALVAIVGIAAAMGSKFTSGQQQPFRLGDTSVDEKASARESGDGAAPEPSEVTKPERQEPKATPNAQLQGALRRPDAGATQPELQTAWDAYSKSIKDATDALSSKLKDELDLAAKRGNLDDAEGWVAAIDALEKRGEYPSSPRVQRFVKETRDKLAKEAERLEKAYDSVTIELTKSRQIEDARRVREEWVSVRQGAGKRGGSNRFAREDVGNFGIRSCLYSWDTNAPAVMQRLVERNLLPRTAGHGVLILKLRSLHANGLQDGDILFKVGGEVLDSEEAYNTMMQGLREGQPVDVVLKRAENGKWVHKPLKLSPVSMHKSAIQDRKILFQGGVDSVAGLGNDVRGSSRTRSWRSAVREHKNLNDVSKERLLDGTLLNAVAEAVSSNDDAKMIAAMEQLSSTELRAMDDLVVSTDWGRLQAGGNQQLSNSEVLLRAWDAVLKSLEQ